MKLFLNEGCPHCEEIDLKGLDIPTTYTDDGHYGGVVPPQVPLLQFDNGMQLNGTYAINTIFDAIDKQK